MVPYTSSVHVFLDIDAEEDHGESLYPMGGTETSLELGII